MKNQYLYLHGKEPPFKVVSGFSSGNDLSFRCSLSNELLEYLGISENNRTSWILNVYISRIDSKKDYDFKNLNCKILLYIKEPPEGIYEMILLDCGIYTGNLFQILHPAEENAGWK